MKKILTFLFLTSFCLVKVNAQCGLTVSLNLIQSPPSPCPMAPSIYEVQPINGPFPFLYSTDGINFFPDPISSNQGLYQHADLTLPGTLHETVYVKDALGCVASATSPFGAYGTPSALPVGTIVNQPSGVGVNDGKISVPIQAYVGNDFMNFSHKLLDPINNTLLTPTFNNPLLMYEYTGLTGGVNYTLYLQFSIYALQPFINNCFSTLPILVPTATASPLVLTSTTTNPLCNGLTGSAIATTTGGASPYFYSLNGVASMTAGNFNNLADGTYTVMVTDANFISTTTTFVITSPTSLAISITNSPICEGVDVSNTSIYGGTPPIMVNFNGQGFVSYPFVAQQTLTFPGQSNVTFNTIASDGNGCTTSQTATIDIMPMIVATPFPITGDVTTNGGNDGFIKNIPNWSIPSMGAGCNTFAYNNLTPSTIINPTMSAANEFEFLNLVAGHYTVYQEYTPSSQFICGQVSLNFTIEEPAPNAISDYQLSAKHNFQFLPNPATDLITITLKNQSVKPIEIVDVLGNKITSIETHTGITKYEYNVSNLPKGIYFLKHEKDTQKLIVQ